MDFLIKWTLRSSNDVIRVASVSALSNVNRAYFIPPQERALFETGSDSMEGVKLFILGDIIYPAHVTEPTIFLENCLKLNIIKELGGFYYIIRIDGSKNISIISGSFNILPIYYSSLGDTYYISSSTKLIRQVSGVNSIPDKQYLLERVIFNYGLFDRTFWVGINTVKTHHFIKLSETFREIAHWDPVSCLVSRPKNGVKVLEEIAEFFCENSQKYMPDEKFALSFTGGFDGRSLLAVAMHEKKDFLAYSFGSRDSEDMLLPKEQAAVLGIDFMPINLEDEYVHEHSYKDSLNLIQLTEGYASFARAHYLYSARTLSSITSIMVTGNFGSEVFRAAHIAGVVISKAIFDVIGSSNLNEIQHIIRSSDKLAYLNLGEFKQEIESLIHDLMQYKNKFHGIDPSSMLYIYNMDEMYRKYFGPEIVMQSHYLNNRSPFLDYALIESIMGTYYCGAYSDYSTENPFKRYKGQLPYSYIIKRASHPLFVMPTGKGYKPSDLIGFRGKVKLVQNLIKKKMHKSTMSSDPFCVMAAFNINSARYQKIYINAGLYDQDLIRKKLLDTETNSDMDSLFNVISTNHYLNTELGGK